MKIIKSKNYRYKEIIKNSEIDPNTFQQKLENVTESVHQGADIYEAIRVEFYGLSTEQIEQIKDHVLQSLGRPVPTSNPEAYTLT